MLHDAKGDILSEGDIVLVRCELINTFEQPPYSFARLKPVERGKSGGNSLITVECGQIEKIPSPQQATAEATSCHR